MDRLDELSVFITILDTGSLAAAARKLQRSPPAVTRSLSALEERVGTRLVERTTRHLAATEAGLRLAERARELLTNYENTVREEACAPLRGKLRITSPVTFGRRHVVPVVIDYLDRYPAMQVDIVFNDRNIDLIEEGLDIAVRIGVLPDTSFVARRVGEVHRMLVASPDYIKRRGMPRTLEELAMHDAIFSSGRMIAPQWRFRRGNRDHVMQLSPRLTINDIDASLLASKAGKGIVQVLSYHVADDLAAGKLVRLLPEFESLPLPVQLVVPSARHMAPKLRTFIDHACNSLSRLEVLQPGRSAPGGAA